MKRAETKRMPVAAAMAAVLFAPALGAADFPEGHRNRFRFELGGAWDSFSTEARLDVEQNGLVAVGTTIDFEKLLGFPVTKSHFRGVGHWRFSRVSYLEFGYESIRRAGQRVIDEEIVWGDTTYEAEGQLDGSFDTDEVYLGYRYDMFRAANVTFAATIGFAYWSIDASLEGEGRVTQPDGTSESGRFTEAVDVRAPVPVIGLSAEGAISRALTFGFYVRALVLRIRDVSGGTLSGGVHLKWYFARNLGLGVGADVKAIRVREYVVDDKIYSAEYALVGPRLFAIVSF